MQIPYYSVLFTALYIYRFLIIPYYLLLYMQISAGERRLRSVVSGCGRGPDGARLPELRVRARVTRTDRQGLLLT